MTTVETIDLLPFNDPEYRANPYPYYARARREQPVYRSPLGIYALTRYADISKMLYDRTLSVEQIDFGPASPLHQSPLGADVPNHTRMRRTISRWFTPKAVIEWREKTQHHLDFVLEEIAAAGGSFDGVLDLAFPVTFRTVCDILGVAYTDALRLRQATYDVGAGLGTDPTEAEMASVADGVEWFLNHGDELIRLKLENPGNGLLDSLLQNERDGEITRDEVKGTLLLLFAVGHLDITYLIVHGLALFAQNPEIATMYADSEEDRAGIIEEILRLDTPEQFVSRLTTQPVQIGDVEIPAGEILILLIGAANMDPEVFPEPNDFNPKRDSSLAKHVAFGGGPHGCAGQVLARAEADAVFTTIAQRHGGVRLSGPIVYGHTDFIRSIKHLPLALGRS